MTARRQIIAACDGEFAAAAEARQAKREMA